MLGGAEQFLVRDRHHGREEAVGQAGRNDCYKGAFALHSLVNLFPIQFSMCLID